MGEKEKTTIKLGGVEGGNDLSKLEAIKGDLPEGPIEKEEEQEALENNSEENESNEGEEQEGVKVTDSEGKQELDPSSPFSEPDHSDVPEKKEAVREKTLEEKVGDIINETFDQEFENEIVQTKAVGGIQKKTSEERLKMWNERKEKIIIALRREVEGSGQYDLKDEVKIREAMRKLIPEVVNGSHVSAGKILKKMIAGKFNLNISKKGDIVFPEEDNTKELEESLKEGINVAKKESKLRNLDEQFKSTAVEVEDLVQKLRNKKEKRNVELVKKADGIVAKIWGGKWESEADKENSLIELMGIRRDLQLALGEFKKENEKKESEKTEVPKEIEDEFHLEKEWVKDWNNKLQFVKYDKNKGLQVRFLGETPIDRWMSIGNGRSLLKSGYKLKDEIKAIKKAKTEAIKNAKKSPVPQEIENEFHLHEKWIKKDEKTGIDKENRFKVLGYKDEKLRIRFEAGSDVWLSADELRDFISKKGYQIYDESRLVETEKDEKEAEEKPKTLEAILEEEKDSDLDSKIKRIAGEFDILSEELMEKMKLAVQEKWEGVDESKRELLEKWLESKKTDIEEIIQGQDTEDGLAKIREIYNRAEGFLSALERSKPEKTDEVLKINQKWFAIDRSQNNGFKIVGKSDNKVKIIYFGDNKVHTFSKDFLRNEIETKYENASNARERRLHDFLSEYGDFGSEFFDKNNPENIFKTTGYNFSEMQPDKDVVIIEDENGEERKWRLDKFKTDAIKREKEEEYKKEEADKREKQFFGKYVQGKTYQAKNPKAEKDILIIENFIPSDKSENDMVEVTFGTNGFPDETKKLSVSEFNNIIKNYDITHKAEEKEEDAEVVGNKKVKMGEGDEFESEEHEELMEEQKGLLKEADELMKSNKQRLEELEKEREKLEKMLEDYIDHAKKVKDKLSALTREKLEGKEIETDLNWDQVRIQIKTTVMEIIREEIEKDDIIKNKEEALVLINKKIEV